VRTPVPRLSAIRRLGVVVCIEAAFTAQEAARVTPARPELDLDWDRPDPNPDLHLPVARALAATCRGWVRSLGGNAPASQERSP
jgi:hypothetical protein